MQNSNSTRLRVLIVDDDSAIRELIATLLKHSGIDAEMVADGDAALRNIRYGQYDAIILDLMLPGTNGFEVLRDIKTNWPSMLPRVVVVTAASERTLGDFDRSGIRKLLRKPFDINELVGEVVGCGPIQAVGAA